MVALAAGPVGLRQGFCVGRVEVLDVVAPKRIIDAHQHVFWSGRDDAGLVANMDAHGIDKAVLLTWYTMDALDEVAYTRSFNPAHAVAGRLHVGLPLADVVSAGRRFPDRFLLGYAPDPTEPRAADWLAAAVEVHHVRVCGEWKFRLPLDDPRCIEIFKLCAEAGLPVVFHLEVPYLPQADTGKMRYHRSWYCGTAGNLARALEACPETIFIGHGPGFWRYISGDADSDAAEGYPAGRVVEGGRLPALLDGFPNLFGELSALSGRNALGRDQAHGREFLLKYHQRLLFGRDCYDGELHALLQSLDLPEEATENVYHRNAERLFRIEP